MGGRLPQTQASLCRSQEGRQDAPAALREEGARVGPTSLDCGAAVLPVEGLCSQL